jgi:septal ring factor EnvC (AmiA/AmiB activator)
MKNTLNETRLDRIERNLEVFFTEMQELKEFQKRNDEQLNPTDKPLNRTDKQLNRTDKQLQKTIKKLDDIGERLRDMGFVQDEVDE